MVAMSRETASDDYNGSYEVPKPGWYRVEFLEAEERESSSGAVYVGCKFVIKHGDFADSWLFYNLNLQHPKDNVRHIALRQLDEMLDAMGLVRDDIEDFDELEGIECEVMVKHRKFQDSTYANIVEFRKTKKRTQRTEAKAETSAKSKRKNDDIDDIPWD